MPLKSHAPHNNFLLHLLLHLQLLHDHLHSLQPTEFPYQGAVCEPSRSTYKFLGIRTCSRCKYRSMPIPFCPRFSSFNFQTCSGPCFFLTPWRPLYPASRHYILSRLKLALTSANCGCFWKPNTAARACVAAQLLYVCLHFRLPVPVCAFAAPLLS